MKKSWIRSLLVVVMALLLVFTLVACTDKNDDKNKPGNNPGNTPGNTPGGDETYTSADYFDNLWTLTSKIGGTAIGATDDLAVKLGVQVSLDTIASVGSQQLHQIDLGLDVQAVVGRTATTASNTALKVRLYDPTDAAHTEILTLYAFANDIDNLYIDFGGQNIKLSHNVAKYVFEALNTDPEATVDSVASISKEIFKGLSNKFIGEGEGAQSINDVINSFVGKFGANWSLNTLVNGVLDMLPFDINSFIQQNQEMVKLIVGDIELVDEDGHINIIEILKAENVGALFATPTKTNETNGSVTHKIALSDMVGNEEGAMGLLASIDAVNALFGGQPSQREVALSYVEKDSKIDSFSVTAKLGGLGAGMGQLEAGGPNIFAIPRVTVTISDLKVEKYDANTNAVTKQTGKTYTSEIAVNEKLTFEGHGIKINAIDGLTKNDIYLNGKVEVGIVGTVDLVNVTNNGTKLYAYVDLTDDGTTEEVAAATPANKTTRLVEISYVNGKFAGKLYKEVSIGDQTYQNFYWEPDFNIATAYKKFVTKTVNDIKAKLESNQNKDKDKDKDENKKESEWSFGMTNWIQAIKLAIPMLKTNNDIEITSNDALATVVAFANAFGKNDWYVNNVKQVVGGKEEIKTVGREEFIIELLTAPMEDDLTMKECFAIFKDMLAAFEEEGVDISDFVSDLMDALNKDNLTNAQRMEIVKAHFETIGVDFDEVKSAAFRVLYLCALQVEIEGVEVPTTAADDEAEVDLVARYIENIKAVLHSKVTVKADAQGGAHLSIEVKIGDAVLSITESLEVIKVVETGDNATFKDLYPADKTGWKNVADFFAEEE